MAFEIIIVIAVFVLVLVFIWGIIKRMVKIIFYAGIIILLVFAAYSYFIYKDFTDLKENFGASEKKVIMVENNKAIAGLLLGKEKGTLASAELERYSSYLQDKNYDEILGNSYKLIILNTGIIIDLGNKIEVGGSIIKNEDVLSNLKSEDSEEKSALFGAIVEDNVLGSKNPMFFFSELRKGNIKVYPETAAFKTMEFIPLSWIKDAGKKMFEKTKEKAKSFVAEESE